jgi:hypothetical protein
MSEDIRKMIDKVKNFKQFVNEGTLLPKKVYRGGSEYGSDDYLNSTFYTDSEIEAKKYAKELHSNNNLYVKELNFKNPLILVKSEIGDGGLYDELAKIFGDKYMPDIYMFPFGVSDTHRREIIKYARNNKYDGIIMDDTDYSYSGIIRSYIEI